eukprot:5095358-Prorocentrum_lima.AAC.1
MPVLGLDGGRKRIGRGRYGGDATHAASVKDRRSGRPRRSGTPPARPGQNVPKRSRRRPTRAMATAPRRRRRTAAASAPGTSSCLLYTSPSPRDSTSS